MAARRGWVFALDALLGQVDARQIAGASTQRLKHYNKVLTEQLAGLKAEIERTEHDFCIEFAAEPDSA